MIIIVALMLGIGAVFYAINAFESAKTNYENTLKLYLKQSLLQSNNSLIPIALKKAQQTYKENPYDPYYKTNFNVDGFVFELLIRDDTNFNINLISQKPYLDFFERLSKEFCIPKDFSKYILYWMGGKSHINISNLNYAPPLSPMGSKQELLYAYYAPSLIYQNNCDKHKKGIYYYLDTKNGSINVNTAPSIMLKALDPNITSFIANEIVNYRKKQTITHLNDLVNINGISVDDIYNMRKIATTKSNTMIIYITSYYRMGGVYEHLRTKIYYDPTRNMVLSINNK